MQDLFHLFFPHFHSTVDIIMETETNTDAHSVGSLPKNATKRRKSCKALLRLAGLLYFGECMKRKEFLICLFSQEIAVSPFVTVIIPLLCVRFLPEL